MKHSLKLLSFALLAFALLACGGKKLTEDDLKQAEASLFNEDLTLNTEAVPVVVEKYCTFVEQNPDAATAPDWLFKALEICVNQKEVEKSGEICEYEDQLRDLDKARAMYERILADYPESELIPSVQASLRNLGKTPEELIKEFEMIEMEDTEE